MIFDEDLDQKTGQPKPRDLADMSLDELADYKAALEGEIIRIDAESEKKKTHKSAMDALFKTKD